MASTQTSLTSHFNQRKKSSDLRVTRSQKHKESDSLHDQGSDSRTGRSKTPVRSKVAVPKVTPSRPKLVSQKKSPSKASSRKNAEYLTYEEDNDDGVAPLDHDDCASEVALPSGIETPSKRKLVISKEPCSPPKIKCPDSAEIVHDPRTVCNAATPSTLLQQLKIISPAANKAEKSSTQKSLFPSEEDLLSKARTALHTHAKTSLPGREEELAFLNEFIQDHLDSKKSGSLYISGSPGTGKTACLSQVLDQPHLKQHFKIIDINCATFKSPKAIFLRIANQLLYQHSAKSGKDCQERIEKHLLSNRKMILMVLDEMDQLDTRSQSVLYTIFEWPLKFPTSIILIGIANALDLTDRLLPRLRAKLDLAPQLLHFAPYNKQQLMDIFTHRLKEADAFQVFQPAALQLLASKLSTVNGDARRALDLARRAVEKRTIKTNAAAVKSPLKEILATPLISDCNSVRRSPRKPMATLPNQGRGKEDDFTPAVQRNSPVKVPHSSPFQVISNSPLTLTLKCSGSPNKSVKENRSPNEVPNSAKKSLFNDNGGCPKLLSLKSLVDFSVIREPSIDIMSVMNVVNEVYGTSQSLSVTTDGDEFPLHQKLAVSSLLLIRREGKSKEITVGKLHDVYRRVCIKRHLEPLDSSAFLSMLDLIESRGILLLPGRGKKSRLTKVNFNWIEDEVVSALKDRDLLSSILRDRSCLS